MTVADVIRHALEVFVKDDPNCTYIRFDAIPDDGTLQGIDYRAEISPDPDQLPGVPYVASIVLVCRQDIPPGVNANDPLLDNGELPPPQPNI
jgi:hypothetical protein